MRDFEDMLNVEELGAVAVEAVVWQELNDEPALDADRLEVRVTNGRVRVAGRVGSDQEHAKVIHVVQTVLDPARFDDAVYVDETLPGLQPEVVDRPVAVAAQGQPALDHPPSALVREEDGDEKH